MVIHSYKDLLVWQRSIELVVEIYNLTDRFPKVEVYGLISQMRRAAVSIPSNIAEGRLRGHRKEYLHFLLNAYGSGGELETQLEISKKLHFVTSIQSSKAEGLLVEVMKMLNAIANKLRVS
ncbi:MAG: S23 ribosomal protein family protein [Parcubacteria group bacterium GW2011_GWA2_51_12]|nr:MAG: S23 ribosomal protein family protein [Parcubacteria group bacterium GW2011_GWA2_51_12]